MLKVVVARAAQKTGKLLAELLKKQGVKLTLDGSKADGIVSYGVRLEQGKKPMLNANAGNTDKFRELKTLKKGGVRVPQFWDINSAIPLGGGKQYVARKFHHMGGRDVRLMTTEKGLRIRRANGWNYVTKFIPSTREFRCWIYRRRHLRTYEKVKTRNVKVNPLRELARNHNNGYGFIMLHADRVPRPAVEQAIAAIEAMQLDFGAIDILLGNDGKYYVLEVNTAPGVEDARDSITCLADKIARWETKGFPTNKREKDGR